MGVSIEYITAKGKIENITPGMRSTMASLLEGHRGNRLYSHDIPRLQEIAETQCRNEDGEGDWDQGIHDNIMKAVEAIKRDGWIIITMEW